MEESEAAMVEVETISGGENVLKIKSLDEWGEHLAKKSILLKSLDESSKEIVLKTLVEWGEYLERNRPKIFGRMG